MSQISHTHDVGSTEPHRHVVPVVPVEPRTSLSSLFTFNQETLTRVSGLIWLAFGILDGLIGLRFLLKLMAANPNNPFAAFIYIVTEPALWIFRGLTATPAFQGIEIEFFDLVAIGVYALLGWVIIRVLWLVFARLR
jgi:YggT family protein